MKLTVPTPPVFSDLDAERQHRKERLVLAFRIFAKFGFDEGVAGHITVRDPILPDHFWVNPFGKHFSQIRVSDLLLVSEDGKIVDGNGILNAAAFAIHSAIHKERPDVIAAAHAHSMYGKSWSALGRTLDPITQDACFFYERHTVFDQYNGVVGQADENEGIEIARKLGDRNHAIILQNHGLLTIGHTVDECTFWFYMLERCCQSQMLAESTG
ncbi:hypothetical protein HK104_001850, partial [Borealophlyctis nickersoniae]